MRVVVDNNVVVDALIPNAQFEADAQEILRLASIKEIDGFVSVNSLTDIFYVLRKVHGFEKAKAMIKKLFLVFDIIGIEPNDCMMALNLPLSDFEDALIAVCAVKTNADYVVSRDEKFIKAQTEVTVITPKQLLTEIGVQGN